MKIPNLEHLCCHALCALRDGVIITDSGGQVLYLNKIAEQLTGWKNEQATGKPINEVFVVCLEDGSTRYLPTLEENIELVKMPDYLSLYNQGTKIQCFVSGKVSSFTNEEGSFSGLVMIFYDVTNRRNREIQLRYDSFHDSLTGLYNRSFFDVEVNRLNSERMLPLSVIVADANGLKLTNDAFGHEKGDALLKKIADVLRSVCRQEDIIARTGGDEFSILLPKVNHNEAEAIAERIRRHCKKIDELAIPVSVSLGSATRSNMSESTALVIKLAEERMYSAKLRESRNMRTEMIQSIRKSLEDHAYETQAHGNRMKVMSLKLAQRIHLSEYERNQLELLSMIHDIGKIAIPKFILSKPDKLGLEEWNIVRKHSEIGYRIAVYSPELSFLADAILSHHERWDGKGYPQGLEGHQIPITSRIIAIADTYDILIHDRPYRAAVTPEDALKEIHRCSGTQFDPELVEHFLSMMENEIMEQAL